MSDPRKQELKDNLAQARLGLRTLLMRLNEEQWHAQVYHDDEPWAVIDLVRHMVDAERGLSLNVRRIIRGEDGIPPDFDRDRWNRSRVRKMADTGPKDLLADMATNRAHLLELIDELQDDDWNKEGRAPWLDIVTVERFLNQIWQHEAGHTADIAEAVGLATR
jgi:hypothetical protein